MIAPLSNHVHHLPVTNFHYIFIVNLQGKKKGERERDFLDQI